MHIDPITAGLIGLGITTLGGISTALIKQRSFINKSDVRHEKKAKETKAQATMNKEHVAVVGEFVTAIGRVESKVDALSELHANPKSMFSTVECEELLDEAAKSHTKMDKDIGTVLTIMGQREQPRGD